MKMNIQKIILFVINIIGGVLVLGSYIYGIKTNPENASDLWGRIPVSMRSIYFASMLLAAIGYFLFTFFILLKLNPDELKIANTFNYGLFHILYILILLPSSAWMPLTFYMLQNPQSFIWFLIRTVLTVVALSSLILLIALLLIIPKQTGIFYRLAITGIAVFFFHTAVLDALIWPAYFVVK